MKYAIGFGVGVFVTVLGGALASYYHLAQKYTVPT